MRPVKIQAAASTSAPSQEELVDFDEVFRRHHGRLVRLAGLLRGDARQAEDVVAEVFARLYRRWNPGVIRDLDAYLRRAATGGWQRPAPPLG